MDIMKKLTEPLPADKHQWRVMYTNRDKTSGKVATYLDRRVIEEWLDDIVGPSNWYTDLEELDHPGTDQVTKQPIGSAISCRLSVRLPGDNIMITREDVGAGTDAKNASTDAFKRAAAAFGVGRYMYTMDLGWFPVEQRSGQTFFTREADQQIRSALYAYLNDGALPPNPGPTAQQQDENLGGFYDEPGAPSGTQQAAAPQQEAPKSSPPDPKVMAHLSTEAKELAVWTRSQIGQAPSPKQKGFLVALINQAADNPEAGSAVLTFLFGEQVVGHAASKMIDKLKKGQKDDNGNWVDNPNYSPKMAEVVGEIAAALMAEGVLYAEAA